MRVLNQFHKHPTLPISVQIGKGSLVIAMFQATGTVQFEFETPVSVHVTGYQNNEDNP